MDSEFQPCNPSNTDPKPLLTPPKHPDTLPLPAILTDGILAVPTLRSNPKMLRYLRLQRLMTQKDLASKSGVSIWVIRKMETGQANVRPLTVRKLSEALGVDAELFIEVSLNGDEA